jgi:hypothetical protein
MTRPSSELPNPSLAVTLRVWTSLAALSLAGAGALTACGPAPEAAGGGQSAAAGVSSTPAPAVAAPGGESGEAGAAGAYEGLDAAASTALRAAHLEGFVLVAIERAKAGAEGQRDAASLIRQGSAEVLNPVAAAFDADGTVADALEAAALALEGPAANGPAGAAALAQARALLDQRIAGAGERAEIVRRQLAIATGLYGMVVTPEFGVDPIEYQHALGAALSARDLIREGAATAAATERAAWARALSEADALIALFPDAVAPQTPAPPGAVMSRASRITLELPAR